MLNEVTSIPKSKTKDAFVNCNLIIHRQKNFVSPLYRHAIHNLIYYLKFLKLRFGNGVCLRNDGNNIHFAIKLLHTNQINRLQPVINLRKINVIRFLLN